MALYKYHYIVLDTKRSPRISLQNIVAGETGNRLWITVTNNGETIDMAEKENGAWKYRVCLRIDSDLGTRRQDSAEENSGITFIEAQTGDHGKINILLSKDSFTAGMNRAVLEIFSKRVADNDTLICSAEWTFRAAKNPTGENAGTVYPSLIAYENELRQLVSDAGDAIDACEDATDAANDSADAANDAADAANDAADAANDSADAANDAADAANTAAQGANAAAEFAHEEGLLADEKAQDAVAAAAAAESAASSANSAASAANAAAAAATAAAQIAKKAVYNVKHDTSTWVNNIYQCYTEDSGPDLSVIADDALFASYVTIPTGETVAVYEYWRANGVVYMKSDVVDEKYILANFDYDAGVEVHLEFELLDDESVTLDKLTAELNNKANIDGSYEYMTVGNAEQIVSSVGIEDSTPYNFRSSGGSVDIGDREELNSVVGGTVCWNQLCDVSKSENTVTKSGVTYTKMDDGSYRLNGTATAHTSFIFYSAFPLVAGRKYYVSGYVKLGNNTGYISFAGLMADSGNGGIYAPTSTVNYNARIDVRLGDSFSNTLMYPMIIDLTYAFGSTIADYIYALEQSNAGSGVAYFRKMFPKPYYAYNSGELLSVQTNLHRMVGFNQWDEEWELGGLVSATGATYSANDRIRSKNFCRCVPSTVYYCKAPNLYTTIWWYDASKGFIKFESAQDATNQKTVTSPSDAVYFKLVIAGNTTTYGNNLCLNISWDGERDGEYEPYVAHEYALDDITLRGILKLDANNNLYADGDRYLSDGTVERRFAERAYQSGDESLADVITDGTTTVYKLTTPTIETADPYTQTQIVDDFGTEEFVDAAVEAEERDVAVPVGSETTYKPNLRAKLEMSPDSPDGDGDYIVRQTNGQNTYIPLVEVKEMPDFPSNDGSYKLRSTVSNGTATLSWVPDS